MLRTKESAEVPASFIDVYDLESGDVSFEMPFDPGRCSLANCSLLLGYHTEKVQAYNYNQSL
ncbi:MAG: hypothetical protein U5J95_02810 [Balneolaceae bacterium]|nr:hypothetical protein [Balneolaceae bacterium]